MKSNKRFSRKLISMILALMMILSMTAVGLTSATAADIQLAETSADTKTIYLSINGQWTQKLCAVYVWDDDYDAGQWLAMKNLDSATDLWTVDIPADYSNITFCSRTAPYFGWTAVKNQTGELAIPDGCDHFTLTGESAGVWDSYATDTENPIGTRIIYFAPNTEWMEIQAAEGHNFLARAYNTTSDSVGVYLDMTLVQGTYGVYPTIWAVEVSEAYTNIEFHRGEGLYADGTWTYWESTFSYGIHPTYNLVTQDEEVYQTGEWSYIDAPEATEPEATEPETTVPETTEPEASEPSVDPVETKTIYFTPNDVWKAAISESGGFSAYSWSDSEDAGTWGWLTAQSDGRYSVAVPADNDNIYFAISYSTEPDAVWNQTESLTIPADSDHFTQDSDDYTTGTWHATDSGSSGNTYYVVFVDSDGKLLSAQTVKEGESATAPADPAKTGYTFTGWDTDFSAVTKDLTVTAQYEANEAPSDDAPTTGSLKIEISGGTGFTISMSGGAARPQGTSYANSKAPINATVTVTANAVEGKEFMGWYNPMNGQKLTAEYAYTFTTTGNDFIKAMFVTEISGVNTVMFMNDKAYSGNGQILDMQYYAAGDEVIFPADPTQVGFDFTGWSMTAEEIATALTNGEDVTVLAVWEVQKVYVAVEIIGGTGSGSTDTEGNYLANYKLTLTADAAPEGKKFAYWTVDGVVKSYSETYSFYPSKACKAEAVFVDTATAIDYEVLVSVDAIDTVSVEDKNVFYYSWYVPEEELGITYVKSGILAVNKDNYTGSNLVVGTTDANVYNRGPAGTAVKPVNNYSWTKSSVAVGDTWVARAYVQYTDATGATITVYSDLAEATK